jgi:hypothetical protein
MHTRVEKNYSDVLLYQDRRGQLIEHLDKMGYNYKIVDSELRILRKDGTISQRIGFDVQGFVVEGQVMGFFQVVKHLNRYVRSNE